MSFSSWTQYEYVLGPSFNGEYKKGGNGNILKNHVKINKYNPFCKFEPPIMKS